MTIGSLDRSLRSPEIHMTKWHILIGCILTKLWVLKGKIWCRSWLPFIFWQIKLCKPLSTHTHNVGMVYKKKLTSKTIKTIHNANGNEWPWQQQLRETRWKEEPTDLLSISHSTLHRKKWRKKNNNSIVVHARSLFLFLSCSPPTNILTCCLSHEIFLFSFPHICAYQGTKFNGQMLFIAS